MHTYMRSFEPLNVSANVRAQSRVALNIIKPDVYDKCIIDASTECKEFEFSSHYFRAREIWDQIDFNQGNIVGNVRVHTVPRPIFCAESSIPE